MSPDENSYSFLLWPKMMTATSTEHSTESSCAFLNRPPLRFRKVLPRVSVGSGTRGAWSRAAGLHGAVAVVLDGLDLNLAAAHGDGGCSGGKAHQTSDARHHRDDARGCEGMWLVSKGLENKRSLVLACAAAAATSSGPQTRPRFQEASKRQRSARWVCGAEAPATRPLPICLSCAQRSSEAARLVS
jgi:hypothetical protein